jgi:hypothetical protein
MPDFLKDNKSPLSPYHSGREWMKNGTDMPIVSIMIMLQAHVMKIVVVLGSGGGGSGGLRDADGRRVGRLIGDEATVLHAKGHGLYTAIFDQWKTTSTSLEKRQMTSRPLVDQSRRLVKS